MFRKLLILAAFAIAMASTDPTYADCTNCRRPVRSLLEAAPARKIVKATAHVAATAVRTTARVAAAPVRAVRHAAHTVRERQPVRRVLRGAARVCFRPLARIRFACQ